MRSKIQVGILVLLMLLVVLAAVNLFYRAKGDSKIAYIRSSDLVERYHGTMEARSAFEKKKQAMLANVDSMRMDFARSRNQYVSMAARMSSDKRMQQEKFLSQQQGQLMQYEDAINRKINEEDTQMMQEVLNQVNSYIEEYALKEGYSYILGTTASGSLLFGDKAFDVTEPVLSGLNKRYKGK